MTPIANPAEASAQDLQSQLQSLLSAAATELQRAGELERLEQLRLETQRPRDTPPVVVFVGEAKTGKSSLVNALLRRPGLSPVDFDIATGSLLAFRHGDREHALVYLLDEQDPLDVALGEIAEWASVEHNPANVKGVRSVEVVLDDALLESITLVDTPGAGGLDAGHGAATLQVLNHADALVFVADAQGVLTAPELRFLSTAAERIDGVVIALARIDQNDAWQTVALENERALEVKAPKFAGCTMIGTSSLNAERAAALGKDDDARGLYEDSGLPALQRTLTKLVAGRAGALRLANAVRCAESGLRAIETRLATRRIVESADPAIKAELERHRARLVTLQGDKASWNRRLDTRLREINLDRADAVTHGVTELRMHYDALSNEKRGADLAQLPSELIEDVSALADRIASDTSDAITQVASDILGELDEESGLAELLGGLEEVTVGRDMHLLAPLRRRSTEFDRLTALQSWSSGRSIGGYAVSLPLLAIGGVPLLVASFAVATVFGWKSHRGRRELMAQADFRSWQREQLLVVQTELNNEFSRAMIRLQPELGDAIRAYLAGREAEVADQIAVHERAAHLDAHERAKARASIDAELVRISGLLAQAAELISTLRSAHG